MRVRNIADYISHPECSKGRGGSQKRKFPQRTFFNGIKKTRNLAPAENICLWPYMSTGGEWGLP